MVSSRAPEPSSLASNRTIDHEASSIQVYNVGTAGEMPDGGNFRREIRQRRGGDEARRDSCREYA